MRSATLISWLLTAGIGAFMLRTWLARGGLRRERAKAGGLPPQLIFGHATAAITGLLTWAAFLATGTRPLAWGAVVLLMAAVCLGLCTVTLWTPYPARKPGERRPATAQDAPAPGYLPAAPVPKPATQDPPSLDDRSAFEVTDDMITRLLAEPVLAQRPGPIPLTPAVLVPVMHGFAAMCTLLLAVLSAIP